MEALDLPVRKRCQARRCSQYLWLQQLQVDKPRIVPVEPLYALFTKLSLYLFVIDGLKVQQMSKEQATPPPPPMIAIIAWLSSSWGHWFLSSKQNRLAQSPIGH